MKISFSTLSSPEWSWEDTLVAAKDLGFDGIEVRGIENELFVPKANPFLAPNLPNTINRLAALRLEIPCLTSSCYLSDKEDRNYYIREGEEYIDLANQLGTPYVRVLGDNTAEPKNIVDTSFVAKNLLTLAQYAEPKQVTLLIETNGYFSDSAELFKLIQKVDQPNVGVLWDIHHPFRFMNESVSQTYQRLKNHIRFVHMKDSTIEDGKLKYKMPGFGDVPVKEALLLLKNDNYQGYISLEWVKRWCLELEDPGAVFPHFMNYVKNIIKE
ncbi:MAG TPA: sugar phosphate isomerase/epimerase [Bacillota bacterium]|nr:sugar phosphate isomerase/epimerase [Bacillota bacterium]